VRLERVTPEYWRVTFDNPPFNIFGPETIPQLSAVITQIEKDPRVRVVVFDSATRLLPDALRLQSAAFCYHQPAAGAGASAPIA
jgi:hypothetical protein